MPTPAKTPRRPLRYFKLATEMTGILSVFLAAFSLYQTNQTIRKSNTIEADKASVQLLLSYYDMKKEWKQDGDDRSIKEPMKTEISAYRALFLAESIFLMMKASDRPQSWLDTVDFLIKDATGLDAEDLPMDTYDDDFAERVRKIFAEGKNNRGERMPKFATKAKAVTAHAPSASATP